MPEQKRILIAPCAFTAELSCVDAAAIIQEAFASVYPDAVYTLYPLSAGGIGTVDAIYYQFESRRYTTPALCGDDQRRRIPYCLTDDKTAVIEAAAIIGEQYCALRSPGGITSYGVGSVAVDALKNGAKHIVFALGDTCSIDGGCGVARALGALFLTERGKPFIPTGATLDEICYIDRGNLLSIDAVCLCDTNDLLLGDIGVVGRYSKEVGRYPEQMPRLMDNLRYLHELIQPEKVGEEGDGAGGGIAYMLRTMFGARFQSSAETMMKILDVQGAVNNSDLVVTAVPHLDGSARAVGYFRALEKYANTKAVFALGLDCTSAFSSAVPWIQRTETLLNGKEKQPVPTEKLKELLFDASVRLAKTLQ